MTIFPLQLERLQLIFLLRHSILDLCGEYLRAILRLGRFLLIHLKGSTTPPPLGTQRGVEMPLSYRQEKAFNAITYFLEHTSMCNKKKLFKLLWLLDSEHYQTIGRTTTGYQYFAWKMGPVPTELHEAMESGDAELLDRFEIEQTFNTKGHATIWLTSKQQFNPVYFSKKELEILRTLSERY